jgi:hypothetical protein
VVHALPSLQEAALLMNTQPVAGLQESSVQGLPSLQVRTEPAQLPLLQMSPVVQELPSLQDAALLTCLQPVRRSHESVVQTLPSLQLGAGPPRQAPPLQMSPAVQALPSLQVSVLLTYWQSPVVELHESVVQGLPSLQVVGLPLQTPATQRSPVVQRLPSLQLALLLLCPQPPVLLQESIVQTLLSLQSSGGPPVHLPPWQESLVVQTLLSLHGPGAFPWLQTPIAGSQMSVVQGLPSLHDAQRLSASLTLPGLLAFAPSSGARFPQPTNPPDSIATQINVQGFLIHPIRSTSLDDFVFQLLKPPTKQYSYL